MTIQNEQLDVYKASAAGFDALYTIIRNEVKHQWKDIPVSERLDTARALVYLNDVARHHNRYLSRAATQDAWYQRATEFASLKNISFEHACLIVQSPTCIIMDNAAAAIQRCGYIWGEFYRFADRVREYDYYATSSKCTDECTAAIKGREIMQISARLMHQAAKIKPQPGLRWLVKLKKNLRTR